MISGNTTHIVVVKTEPGYAPDPGHHGTGEIVATFCCLDSLLRWLGTKTRSWQVSTRTYGAGSKRFRAYAQ